ncbi:hypothetical protein ACSN7O_004529 [Enterobacter chuandaensis]
MSEPIRELSEPELSQVGGGGLLADLVNDAGALVVGVIDAADKIATDRLSGILDLPPYP